MKNAEKRQRGINEENYEDESKSCKQFKRRQKPQNATSYINLHAIRT